MFILPCNKPCESSSAASDNPTYKRVMIEYHTAVDCYLTSGTLVSLLRNLFAETTDLLGKFCIKSALN
jgi:hypothetical protein